jgi:hypothetical protein
MEIERIGPPIGAVTTNETTKGYYTPENHILNFHHRGNLKSTYVTISPAGFNI